MTPVKLFVLGALTFVAVAPVLGCSNAPGQAATQGQIGAVGGLLDSRATFDHSKLSFKYPSYLTLDTAQADAKFIANFKGSTSFQCLVSVDSTSIPDTATHWTFNEKVTRENPGRELIFSEAIPFGDKAGYRVSYSTKLSSDPSVTGFCGIVIDKMVYTLFYNYKKSDPMAAQFDADMKALLGSWNWK